MSTLTGTVGLKVGPLVLETLVKHYFDRIRASTSSSKEREPPKDGSTNLRQDEILYDQIFSVVKSFMATAAKHTVEELQEFSNTRTPSPPWVRVVRIHVPMSSCDDAAEYLIKALGGEEVTRRVVGGTRWWQVRGVKGVSAEWITAKKDWREAKARYQAREKHKGRQESASADADDSDNYQPEMDEQRCILYLHGGGYYFGSVDQERYSIQRFARKINGRVFAVNYRLSPQYPFPCAIQDAIASYLYLIRPPEGALHRAVKPEHIIIMGDSAGGGLSLALLQVIRDSGLPAPASGVLVSPWCDMSHSFPSIHENTATDVIPYYGLSLHKPSTLWPPPPEPITKQVHRSLKTRIRQVARLDPDGRLKKSAIKETADVRLSTDDLGMFSKGIGNASAPATPIDLGATTQPPSAASGDGGKLTLTTKSGEVFEVESQIQLYAPNNLLGHPLVSSVGAYLGGLPPLFFMAGDKEVLRDEAIYTAHKAANPAKYPLKDEVKKLCPSLEGIETKYGPTQVHLQVYDDCAHVLPVLFAFTTPAKYCFRAIAGFCRYTTKMVKLPNSPPSPHMIKLPETPVTPQSPSSSTGPSSPVRPDMAPVSMLGGTLTETPAEDATLFGQSESSESLDQAVSRKLADDDSKSVKTVKNKKSWKNMNGKASWARVDTSQPNLPTGRDPSDVGGPRFEGKHPQPPGLQCARDDPQLYVDGFANGNMIRERVATNGVIRPLEPEPELCAFRIAPEDVGAIPELSIKRYIDGKTKYDKKFANTMKQIEKQRQKNFELAKKEGVRTMSQLQDYLAKVEVEEEKQRRSFEARRKDTISGSWNWGWALDGDERPPPSSIASRRDTEEARALAKIADFMPENTLSGNNLWSHLVNFLTVSPDRAEPKEKVVADDGAEKDEDAAKNPPNATTAPKTVSGKWRSNTSMFWKERFQPSKGSSKFRDRPKSRTIYSFQPPPETTSPATMSTHDLGRS